MKCPFCHIEGFTLLQDEVDIGVGVQTHIVGGECEKCGPLACCSDCGRWQPPIEFEEEHETWCKYRSK